MATPREARETRPVQTMRGEVQAPVVEPAAPVAVGDLLELLCARLGVDVADVTYVSWYPRQLRIGLLARPLEWVSNQPRETFRTFEVESGV